MPPIRSLRARIVLPIAGEPIDGGVVGIRGDRIVSVGRRAADGPVEDLGDVALLPGLVNAHAHLELSHVRAPLGEPGIAFAEWIRRLVAAHRRGNMPGGEAAVAAGLAESLAGGVTRLGDIVQPDWTAGPYAKSPIRATLFLELIAPTFERIDAQRRAARAHLEAAPPLPFWQPGVSPHAPYSVHPALLEDAVRLAARRGAGVAMHLAESREELHFLATGEGPFRHLLMGWDQWDGSLGEPGRCPRDFLRALASAPRALVIHGNYLDSEDTAFLAERSDRMSVVYCPRTHGHFRHDPYPLERMLAQGVRVALGTDSRASSPDLSLLAELRHAVRRHPLVAPRTLVQMATLAGAEALGGVDPAGRIEPGRRADLVAVALDGPPGRDPFEAIVHGAGPIAAVWCGGARVDITRP
ncbi:MAG: amidohydrolase family protein [Pirellulales bacterium]|nr:amidohydrolase family protein [Pirellulales bacterium]